MDYKLFVVNSSCSEDFVDTYIKRDFLLNYVIDNYEKKTKEKISDLRFIIKMFFQGKEISPPDSIILNQTSNFLFKQNYHMLNNENKNQCDLVIGNIVAYLGLYDILVQPFSKYFLTDKKDEGTTNIKNLEIKEIKEIIKLIKLYNSNNIRPQPITYGNKSDDVITLVSNTQYRNIIKTLIDSMIREFLDKTNYDIYIEPTHVEMSEEMKSIEGIDKDNKVYINQTDFLLLRLKKGPNFPWEDLNSNYLFTYYCSRIINTRCNTSMDIDRFKEYENFYVFCENYFEELLNEMLLLLGDSKTSHLKAELKKIIYPMYEYLLSLRTPKTNLNGDGPKHQSDTKIKYLLFHYIMCFNFIKESNHIVQIYKNDPNTIKIKYYMDDLLKNSN